jgi:hypothetical protein
VKNIPRGGASGFVLFIKNCGEGEEGRGRRWCGRGWRGGGGSGVGEGGGKYQITYDEQHVAEKGESYTILVGKIIG